MDAMIVTPRGRSLTQEHDQRRDDAVLSRLPAFELTVYNVRHAAAAARFRGNIWRASVERMGR
jgi:hypothetical protein